MLNALIEPEIEHQKYLPQLQAKAMPCREGRNKDQKATRQSRRFHDCFSARQHVVHQ